MDVGTVNLLIAIAAVVVLAGAAALVVRSVRRSWSSDSPLSLPETVAVSVIGSGALLAIPLSLYGLIASGVQLANAAAVRVNGIAVSGGEYPPILRASDAPVDAGYETAWIEVANLPAGARWLLWGEQALTTLIGLTIAVAVAWLALALLRGRPFTRTFPWVLAIVAIAIMVGGIGSQFVGALARSETVAFLGDPQVITGAGGFSAFSFALDLGPIGWGLGIGLVAGAFQIGTRLQRETAGLV